MSKSISTERHRLVAELIRAERKRSGLSQSDVATAMGRHQPFIANIETGERRVDIVEFIILGEIIGFDPAALIEAIRSKSGNR